MRGASPLINADIADLVRASRPEPGQAVGKLIQNHQLSYPLLHVPRVGHPDMPSEVTLTQQWHNLCPQTGTRHQLSK